MHNTPAVLLVVVVVVVVVEYSTFPPHSAAAAAAAAVVVGRGDNTLVVAEVDNILGAVDSMVAVVVVVGPGRHSRRLAAVGRVRQ